MSNTPIKIKGFELTVDLKAQESHLSERKCPNKILHKNLIAVVLKGAGCLRWTTTLGSFPPIEEKYRGSSIFFFQPMLNNMRKKPYTETKTSNNNKDSSPQTGVVCFMNN